MDNSANSNDPNNTSPATNPADQNPPNTLPQTPMDQPYNNPPPPLPNLTQPQTTPSFAPPSQPVETPFPSTPAVTPPPFSPNASMSPSSAPNPFQTSPMDSPPYPTLNQTFAAPGNSPVANAPEEPAGASSAPPSPVPDQNPFAPATPMSTSPFAPPASDPTPAVNFGATSQMPSFDPQPLPSNEPPPFPGASDPSTAAPTTIDQAPTDLSHLIGDSVEETAPPSQPETLAPTSNGNPEIPTLPAGNTGETKLMPKWVIGVAIGSLIAVAGASAYFILGVGQPKPVSLPATQSATPPPAVTSTPQPTPTPSTTGSANFGQIQGNTTPQATSAADLIRLRQQAQ